MLDTVAELKARAEPFAVATVVRTEDATSAKAGAKALVREDGTLEGWIGGGCVQTAVRRAALRTLATGEARLIRVEPPDRLGRAGPGPRHGGTTGSSITPATARRAVRSTCSSSPSCPRHA